jgi:hypothetical protein
MTRGIRFFRSLIGCTAFVAATVLTVGAQETPTYYRDIAPIIQQNCQSCHRQGEIAPMAFENYHQVRPWAKAIRESIQQKTMPPGQADERYGHFRNAMRLSTEEAEAVIRWASMGAPAGKPADAPPPVEYPTGWTLGEPDEIFMMTEPYTLAAEGTDEYKYFTIPTNHTEDKWITGVEIIPGNSAIVHHVIVFIQEPGMPDREEGGIVPINSRRPESPEELERLMARQETAQERVREAGLRPAPIRPFGMLGGMAPGTPPQRFDRGHGKLLKAGSKLVFQMHYSRTGQDEIDQTMIGLHYAQEPVEHEVITTAAANWVFAIPPHADNYRVDAWHTFDRPIRIHMFMPHLHLRGKSFDYVAIYPDGRSETLLSIPKYDFNWQFVYEPVEPITLPAGTTIHCIAHFDNSAGNPDNPDPEAIVRFGEPTVDEMMIGWMDVSEVKAKDTPGTPVVQPAAQTEDLLALLR